MKQLHLSTISLGMILSIALIGCEKSEPLVIREKRNLQDAQQAKVQCLAANPSNKYDDVGPAHNAQLDALIANEMKGDVVLSTEEDVYDYYKIKDKVLKEAVASALATQFAEKPAGMSEEMFKRYKSRPDFFHVVSKAVEIIRHSGLDLHTKISRLTVLESRLGAYSLTGKEKEILLRSLSVARYSLYFWAPISAGGLGKIDDTDDGGDNFDVDWYELGREDFMSACYGAFFTANPLVALGGGVAGSAIGYFF